MPTSSRLILHLSRLKIAVPAATLVRCGCPAPAASSGWAVGAGARRDVDRCIPAAQARARGRGAARADLLPDTEPPPARPRAAAAPPSRGRGGRALQTVCRTQRRNRRLRRRAVPEPLDALESRAKGGERDAPHPRPPTERTGPARAPRSASRIPPSKIWNRWRGAALARTSFGGSFCVPRPEHGAALARERRRPCTPARPPSASGGPRGRLALPRRSHLYKKWKGGKRQLTRTPPSAAVWTALARGPGAAGPVGGLALSQLRGDRAERRRRHGDARPRAGGARVFTGVAGYPYPYPPTRNCLGVDAPFPSTRP